MAVPLHPDGVEELLEESRRTLQAEFDRHCEIMRRQIDAALGAARVLELRKQQQRGKPQADADPSLQFACPISGISHISSERSEARTPGGIPMTPATPMIATPSGIRASLNDGISHINSDLPEARNSGGIPMTPATPMIATPTGIRASVNEKHVKSKKYQRKLKQVAKLAKQDSGKDEIASIQKKISRWMKNVFDKILAVLVVANVVVMFCELQHQAKDVNASLGESSQHWPHADAMFRILEIFFCIVFGGELLLRLFVERLLYFTSAYNILDAIVVPLMVFDAIAGHLGPSLSFARVFRVLRIICAVRMVRTISYFQHLRILWNTIASSLAPFIYSMTIMFLCMLMLAILLTQTLRSFILDESNDITRRTWVHQYFGDGVKSLWTVFELTFSGCWPNYVRPIVEEVSWLYAPLFVVYVTAVIFAMSRIVSAMFLKETLQQASADTEMMVRDRAKSTSDIEKNLVALFHAADHDHNGMVTLGEFLDVLSHERIKLWLGMLGVDGSDPVELFNILGGGAAEVHCDAFVYGIKRIKGEARSQDLIPLLNDCKRILNLCEQTQNMFNNVQAKVFSASAEQPQTQTLSIEQTTYDV